MTQTKIADLVDEAVILDREIATNTERLKEIKRMLITEAQSRPEEHQETDGGGSSMTLVGFDGCIARISFPAPTLKSSIDGETPAGSKLLGIVGRLRDDLFTPSLRWVPVENFRARASELFEPKVARQVVKACETASSPRVSFETAEKSDQ